MGTSDNNLILKVGNQKQFNHSSKNSLRIDVSSKNIKFFGRDIRLTSQKQGSSHPPKRRKFGKSAVDEAAMIRRAVITLYDRCVFGSIIVQSSTPCNVRLNYAGTNKIYDGIVYDLIYKNSDLGLKHDTRKIDNEKRLWFTKQKR